MKSLCALLVVAIIQGAIGRAEKFITEPMESNIVLEGEEVMLSCITKSEATCAWNFVVPRLELINTRLLTDSTVQLADGSLRRTDPESKTDCSIVIPSVDERHMGSYTCTPFIQSSEAKSTTAQIIVAAMPTSFAFTEELAGATELTAGTVDPVAITCEARDGRPKAELHWFLGDRELTDNVTNNEDVTDPTAGLVTSSSTLEYQFEQHDEGAQLRCQAVHPAYDGGHQEIDLIVAVQFAPFRAEGSDLGTVYGFTEGQNRNITVNFTSNPAPSTIEWTLGSETLSAGDQTLDGVVTAGPLEQVDAESHQYAVRLMFYPVEADYQNTTISVRVANAVGQLDLTMMVDADAPPPAPSAAPQPDPEGGVSGGAIGGIIAAIIVLLVLIALVAFARSRGKWCFAAKPSDAGAEALVTKKKEGDVESAANKEETKELTAPDGEGSPKREQPDVVYAELVLDKDGVKTEIRPSPEKTEYAVIVGTKTPEAKE